MNSDNKKGWTQVLLNCYAIDSILECELSSSLEALSQLNFVCSVVTRATQHVKSVNEDKEPRFGKKYIVLDLHVLENKDMVYDAMSKPVET